MADYLNIANSGILVEGNAPVTLLQELIRFDTTNPPGNEAECIKYIDNLLKKAGFETTICAMKPERPNLVARLKGKGTKPPLLMYGHVDVVPTTGQNWTYDPFSGLVADGYVWGRGALDMKGVVVMMISALIHAKAEGITPSGDVILCVLSDEEVEGEYGAKYMVEQHAELFKDVKYAIGEVGGFTLYIGKKRFYPIMIAEKQKCSVKITIRGPSGHGSMPLRDGAMAKLGYVLQKLNTGKLPVHITPPTKLMIEAIASNMPAHISAIMRTLLKPALTNKVLKTMGAKGAMFEPILRNTVSPTIVRGGDKINVIPGELILELDGRVLPGYTPEDLLNEMKALLGHDMEYEFTNYVPCTYKMDMGFYDTLADVLRDSDKGGIPIPLIVGGCTDGRHFARIGIQTYGFTPMKLPENFNFIKLIHSANERMPIDALEFGVNTIYEMLKRI